MLRKSRDTWFSNVELFVMMALIGILALVAVPSYLNHRMSSQANCLSKKFRTYAEAFRIYAEEQGDWPPSEVAGRVPAGMEKLLPEFASPTVIGGVWQWEHESNGNIPAISLVNPRNRPGVVTRIDRILDDGDPSTGCLTYVGGTIRLLLDY